MSHAPTPLAERLAQVHLRIAAALARRGPGPRLTLIGVSKHHPAAALLTAWHAGLLDFGENYAQELTSKVPTLPADARWHFIGPLQSNKARLVVTAGALLHTLDRPSLLPALAKEVRRLGAPSTTGSRPEKPFCTLVEVNIGDEPQKAGVATSQLPALLDAFVAHPELRCVGLMAIPPEGTPEQTRPYFARLRQLLHREAAIPRPGVALTELSMGMSNDFEAAIEEGATMVRVGTAIFGPRPY